MGLQADVSERRPGCTSRASRAERIRKLCLCGAFTAFAFALSYVEYLLPIGAILPLPGVKPGLANIAVTLAFVFVSPTAAAAVSLCRVILSALLFGTPISFLFSLSGALLAYCGLWAARLMLGSRVSYIGVSVGCAACHSIGQIAAACLIFGSFSVIRYLPVLLVSSAVFGCVTGTLADIVAPRLVRVAKAPNERVRMK